MAIKELDSKENSINKKEIDSKEKKIDKIFNEYIKKLNSEGVVNNRCDKYGHLID